MTRNSAALTSRFGVYMNEMMRISRHEVPAGTGVRRRPRRSLVTAVMLMGATIAAGSASAATGVCSEPAPELQKALSRQAPTLNPDVLRLALGASQCAAEQGLVTRRELLTVIDYSLPSTTERLFVFDVAAQKLLYRELVAHGKNTGENYAKSFSNVNGSLATSIGLYVTDSPYVGSNGYSLRLKGLDRGFNDNAWQRAIVMHGAKYVNAAMAKTVGRIGRSWGCPAVRPEVARKLIDTLKGGAPVFAYYPDQKWLSASAFIPQGMKMASAGTSPATSRARR